MIKLWVNGSETKTSTTNLEEFLLQYQSDGKRFAVALNETFVSKTHYVLTELVDGDRLEFVVPMQGG